MDLKGYFFINLALILWLGGCKSEKEEPETNQKFHIDGKVVVSFQADPEWISTTRILVDGGQYLGFVKTDGTFTINNIPTGSYVVEVSHPVYVFEPARVDITSKGKIRARRVNNIQPSSVNQITYPLKFKAKGKANYFQPREQWRITDFLFTPMVMMMVLPLLMVVVVPKLINTADPETQKEMQNMNLLNPKQNMPEMSELLTSWLGGGNTSKKPTKSKAVKRRT